MAKRFEDLRVRLIQIRVRPDVIAEEQQTFLDRTQLQPTQLLVSNAVRQPLDDHLLEDIDAVIIGGAGAYSVTHTYGWTDDLLGLVSSMYDRSIPLFGSCWGHQFIARALGGEVIHDPERIEIGCGSVQLTEAGKRDALFREYPLEFKANMGHQDRIATLPEEAVELALSDIAPFQAFRIRNKPIYGTQFHSELDATSERARLIAYRSHYPSLQDDVAFDRIMNSLRETTEVDGLLNLFLRKFAL